MKTILLVLFLILTTTTVYSGNPAYFKDIGTNEIYCPDLANKGFTPTFMDGFCNSLDSCTKLLTCRFSAEDVSNGSFDKSLKLWDNPSGEYLLTQMDCWLLANKFISSNLKFGDYYLKNCWDGGLVYNLSYLQGRPYWSEIKHVEPFKSRIFSTSDGTPSVFPFPIRFKDSTIALNHPLSAGATYGSSSAKMNIKLSAGMDVAIIDGASDPADAGENPYKSLTLQPSAAFLDKHKEDCAIVVNTSQPVIIQNLTIDGFNKGICVYEGATVIVFNVTILKSKHAILANSGKVLVRNSYLASSESAVVSANSKFSNVLLVNTKVVAPALPNETIVLQDKFYQIPSSQPPMYQSSSPTLRVSKISDTQAIGKLTWPTAEAAAKYGTYDTFVIYVQGSASDNFKELQRVTGSEMAEIEKGFLIHNVSISGLSDSALFTVVVIKGKISPELSLATREIWFKMVDQDAVPLRSSFSFPANFENTVVGGDHIMHLCQAGETASVQFTPSSVATSDIAFDLKLGEDLRLIQHGSPVSSRQTLVLSKEGNEILLKTVPKFTEIYAPLKPYKDGWYWQYVGIKDGTFAKIILNGTGSIAVARADDPSPCTTTLTQKPLPWNSEGQIEVLFAGASSIRLQKNNQPSADTSFPDFGKMPQLGEGINFNPAFLNVFGASGFASMIIADKKVESAKSEGDAKAEGGAKKGDDTKDGEDSKDGNDVKGGSGPTGGATGGVSPLPEGQKQPGGSRQNPLRVETPAAPVDEGGSSGCSLIRP